MELAKEWLRLDRDPDTRSEIENLILKNDYEELENRLATRLSFGTAGLRGQMGAGFSRLNCLTIIQTSQGFAEYVLDTESGAAQSGVVIGYDARHNSKRFAEFTAAVFIAKGIKVWWYEDLVHTPMVPFGVRHLGAAAGIMITASHNPAQDNGYKVYGSNGCQINSPADSHIASAILRNLEPQTWEIQKSSPLKVEVLFSMKADYLAEVCHKNRDLSASLQNPLKFVYTPMHGVGLDYLVAVLEELKLLDCMKVVEQQASPNPDFPTVNYPNPEEKGALDFATLKADKENFRFVLANDPDADRFAAAEKTSKGWHQFTGDEVGVLLAVYLMEKKSKSSKNNGYMLVSAVSSEMLSFVAADKGFVVIETLTGFKWLGNKAFDLEQQNKTVHFAYEEALGYMIPKIVFDKDGITAAIIFLRACVEWGSPWGMLQRLYRKYGYFQTTNTYWRSPNVSTTLNTFEYVRSLGNPYPVSVGGRKVVRWRDLTKCFDSGTTDNIPLLPSSASSQMITCWLNGSPYDQGVRFTIRSSGTEPKIKIYLECRSNFYESAKAGAYDVLRSINRDWFNNAMLTIEDRYSHFLAVNSRGGGQQDIPSSTNA